MHSKGVHGPSGYGKHQNPTGFGMKKGLHPTGVGWKYFSDPKRDQKLHKYWSFHTKHKAFMITLSIDGGSVRICERTRLFGYEIGITIDAAHWMIGILEELKKKDEQHREAFKRFFRNSNGSYFMECFAKSNGAFLKISTLKNNKVRMVIIPEEAEAKGWANLYECLFGVLKRKPESVQDGVKLQKEIKTGEGRKNSQSWANIVKGSGQQVSKTMGGKVVKQMAKPASKMQHNKEKKFVNAAVKNRGKIEWRELYPELNLGFKPKNLYPEKRFKQPKFYEYMRSKAQPKDWRLAIILARDNTHADWSTIFFNLSRELERKLIVSQLFDDRCIIWCKDDMEKDELVKVERMYVSGAQSHVTFSLWSWNNQKNNVKVECKGSWMGVQGLPLNLSHMRIFRKIGEMCGGLLDVDNDTAEASLLSNLRLQLMGDEFGFVPETLTLEHDNMSFELQLCKLNDLSYRFHGWFNTCWYQDFHNGRGFGDGEETREDVNLQESNLDSHVSSDCAGENRDVLIGVTGGYAEIGDEELLVLEAAADDGGEGGSTEVEKTELEWAAGNNEITHADTGSRLSVSVSHENAIPNNGRKEDLGSIKVLHVFSRLMHDLNRPSFKIPRWTLVCEEIVVVGLLSTSESMVGDASVVLKEEIEVSRFGT
ncbi:hypothetical protein G4B88_000669 [Cannabis sativa]|uniref:DUF4283 domain-containing protein n=1 Tax=Cannabis sativa TaxID=3483 RepID=A0A7J6HHH7_CANSA|nr:hypothetical protein G4B88_000669 [Cannabis sativa]